MLSLHCLLYVVVLLWRVGPTLAQKDPLQDFCRIHGHQTAVVDRKLYINGGYVNWDSNTAINYTNTWTRYGDLDVDNDGFPQEYILTNNNSVPAVAGGILWPDYANKILYLYGGEYGDGKPDDFQLWFYDIVYKTWNVSTAGSSDIKRASWGAGVTIQDKARGYYYGGWLSNSSVPSYQSQTPLSNIIVYDMIANSFRNLTGPDTIPRAEGVMLYLPAGDAGMLLYFGGIQSPGNNGTMTAQSMTDILIFDIANEKWYTQKASGKEVPDSRRRFCAGATWADDRSSYNIYIYGGASVGAGVGFGDVWILSIPSFRWIKYYPLPADGYGDPYPHHSLSCNTIANAQMIIMGGTFPNHTECDVPKIYGQHGLDLGKANPDGARWAKFNPNVTTYHVPDEIISVIGGTATGGATLKSPESGWGQRDLEVVFSRAYTESVRPATRDIPRTASSNSTKNNNGGGGETNNTGAIIGGAVGGALGGLLLIIATILICLRHRRKKKLNETPPAAAPAAQISELPSNTNPYHDHNLPPYASPHSYHNDDFQWNRSPGGNTTTTTTYPSLHEAPSMGKGGASSEAHQMPYYASPTPTNQYTWSSPAEMGGSPVGEVGELAARRE